MGQECIASFNLTLFYQFVAFNLQLNLFLSHSNSRAPTHGADTGMLYAMRCLKERLRIHTLHFVVIGVNDAIQKELEVVMKSYDELGANNGLFPKWTNAHIFDVPS